MGWISHRGARGGESGCQLNRGSRPGNPGSNLKPKEPYFSHLNSACPPAFSPGGGPALRDGCDGPMLSGSLLLSRCNTHRDGLLLDAAHRQHFACEGDLACHGQVLPHWPVQSQGEQGRDDGAAGTRAVLGGGTLRGDRQVSRQPGRHVTQGRGSGWASPQARASGCARSPGTCWRSRAASGRPWRKCRRCGRSPSSPPPAGQSPPGSHPCPPCHCLCPSAVSGTSQQTAWSLLGTQGQSHEPGQPQTPGQLPPPPAQPFPVKFLNQLILA